MAPRSKEPTKAYHNQGNPYRPNGWGMIRDIIIASMNKGQFLVAGVWLLLLILFLKLSPNQAYAVVRKFGKLLVNGQIAGWVLLWIVVIAWLFHSKYQRRNFTREMKRIAQEKKDIQQTQLGTRLGSSQN